MNLFSNALKFTGRGGKIEIRIREYQGTGIGLSLAKELVEMHGGTISVQSKHIGDACCSGDY